MRSLSQPAHAGKSADGATMNEVLQYYHVRQKFIEEDDGSLVGPCPIHDGRSSTQFRVSSDGTLWNCFGSCHCGGDTIDFVAMIEGISREVAEHRLTDQQRSE